VTIESDPVRVNGVYYGWYIVAICVLTQVAANAVAMSTFSLFLRPWSAEMHTPISALLLALSACGTVFAFVAPLTGTLADKYPARVLFGGGLLLLTLVLLGLSFAHKTWQIIALYALPLAVAMSLTTDLVCNSVLSRWFVRRRGLALGISGFGLGAGGVVLPPIVAALLPELG
jgi:MFS family permease